MDTVIVPIVKHKKGDLGSKNNFKPIALTTIMSKLFEILILNRYGDLLHSTDNQFGYKKKHVTDLCVYTLKQVVDYYRSNSSPVYICFLDASKAIDRINYDILCKKLASRNLPNVIVRILHVWFSRQCFYVKCWSVLSQSFHATNCLRQGGILSPHLFNVYINELSIRLNSQFFGCHINSICYNHLVYAEDTVLLAPSPKGLQMLIDMTLIRRATPFFCVTVTQQQITKVAESNLVTINWVLTVSETQIKFYWKCCCKYLIFAHMDTIVWLERWPLEK